MKYALGAALAAFIFAGCGDDYVGKLHPAGFQIDEYWYGDRGFENLQKYHVEQRGKRRAKDD